MEEQKQAGRKHEDIVYEREAQEYTFKPKVRTNEEVLRKLHSNRSKPRTTVNQTANASAKGPNKPAANSKALIQKN